VLTYGCEVWALKTAELKQLSIFERKIMRKIFGPLRLDDGTYRIRYNDEIEHLMGSETITRFVKSQRLRWLGHVLRMEDEVPTKKMFLYRDLGCRARGRPKRRWIDSVEADLRVMGIQNYKQKALDRDEWRKIVKEALAHTGL